MLTLTKPCGERGTLFVPSDREGKTLLRSMKAISCMFRPERFAGW